jgi:hypothetical protein
MMKIKVMSVAEYAESRKVSKVAVTRAMKKGKPLVGVSSYGKVGRDWMLNVKTLNLKKNIGHCVVI